jgi:hypothetical protein
MPAGGALSFASPYYKSTKQPNQPIPLHSPFAVYSSLEPNSARAVSLNHSGRLI